MTERKRLKIVHASLRVFDSDKEAKFDLTQLLTLNAHVYLGTESGDTERRALIHDVFEANGYVPHVPKGTDGWIAVRSSLIRPGWEAGCVDVLPSGRQAGDPHHYQAKGIVSIQWDHPSLGHIGFAVTHALTQGRWPNHEQADKPGDPVDHYKANTMLMHALAHVGNRISSGGGLAWVSADTNMRDQNTDVFRGAAGKWQTCWDELGVYPPTLQGSTTTMDVIGTRKVAHRIKLRSAKALADKDLRMNTDHHVVVAEYDVDKIRKAP